MFLGTFLPVNFVHSYHRHKQSAPKKKGSDPVVRSTLRAVPATGSDPFFSGASHEATQEKGSVEISVITEKLGKIMAWRQSHNGAGKFQLEEQPLRAELYSVEQLERHAKALAASHQLATGPAADKLIARLGRERAHPRSRL